MRSCNVGVALLDPLEHVRTERRRALEAAVREPGSTGLRPPRPWGRRPADLANCVAAVMPVREVTIRSARQARCGTVIYDLWDSQSGNIIGTFTTKEGALSVVRKALSTHGAAYVETLLFGQEDRRCRTRANAQGRELVELVLAGEPARLAHT